MALMSWGSSNAERNMTYLRELLEQHSVKIALLNEASVYHLRLANEAAVKDGDRPPFVFSKEGIKGRDFWTDDHGTRKLKVRKRWSAAVMSPLGPDLLGEEDVRARAPSRRNPVVDIPFTNSRPGTWIAATVRIGRESVTCVSLYGLIEELTDASMHRSLSEISPIFSDPRYNELVLLGGDFNVSTGMAEPSARERSRIVLDRIEAYGLDDCLAKWVKDQQLPPMAGCRCEDKPCRHTLTRITPNKRGANVPWQERSPIQVDYLFASRALASRLDEIIEIPPDQWERYSDHRPIIAKFRAD
jgi:endonuclease/exonuclease/phosphatase family metal-dependent hydrolase